MSNLEWIYFEIYLRIREETKQPSVFFLCWKRVLAGKG